ncbi:apolipoprotein L3-like [Erpetoichthys calabaricus]|uniref:Apolipoprotein L3-like n=1 Tax=Erpetoichthys calabaricus TaxID=27687 RepID=A0A8C4RM86_ERPCA|nr:apolipoprotein L3-like [Erpetoichthys calabaricus]
MSEENNNLLDFYYSEERWNGMSSDEEAENEELSRLREDADKGITLLKKLINDRIEDLQKNIRELHSIADGVDSFHKKATIANITGGSVSAVGGIVTIVGLILTPFTLGASLVVTGVGLGVAAAGGVTSASATISDTVNNSLDRKKVEDIIERHQKGTEAFVECLKTANTCIRKMEEFLTKETLLKTRNKVQLGTRATKVIASAGEIGRLATLAKVSGGVARAVKVAGVATGILSGLFLGLDVFFIAKDSIDLHKGAKTEFAAKIREVANELQCGLHELNEINTDLQRFIRTNALNNYT